MNEIFTPAMIIAIITGAFVLSVWLGAACMIRDERLQWRAFGAGDYGAAQKCANEGRVPVEDAPHDEDTEKVVVNA